MAAGSPITKQISRSSSEIGADSRRICVSELEHYSVVDRNGEIREFSSLFQRSKAIIIFVRHFLCYTCKEYVEDLGKIPREALQEANVRLIVIGHSSFSHIKAFCTLTGYAHEIYVDPEKHLYNKLGMRRGETYMETPSISPHVKSGLLSGSLKSVWRAMTSSLFDFQGDPQQQGGALIMGPGPVVHFSHYDMNRFDHVPIDWLLQLADLQSVDFTNSHRIIHI
ncbi:hypothetical protein DNTS_014534 [Danionella cerebrum]|uniref:Thioredoxin domain-containing protein n=1 Tax=Danionella cerebrum TaxID=2873325 RepID=A0A553RLU1_9TELE|nr:hypothetical protein DNTS_014534 [Danionella translucida]TRZ03135.1 hypothetical protein DNTS_014534 [Danionella translucida]